MITQMLNRISDMTMDSTKVREDIILIQFTIVNACIVSNLNGKKNDWILIDTALESSADDIVKVAEENFGKGTKPKAIILTHGHFDHVGSVIQLANRWNVDVYAHQLEIPYLTGKKDYPQGDPSVGGGLVAEMSPSFPHKAIDLGNKIKTLPEDGTIPFMENWRWIHTPGHTEGHVSLYREKDGVLIVGDAFVTTKQESLMSVLNQTKDFNGPPAYLTTDWKAAEISVKKLASLKPELILPSHGLPMNSKEISTHLDELARHFENVAVPEEGRFVK